MSGAIAEDLRMIPGTPSIWGIRDDVYDEMGLPK
jgi:hypothetical protein